MSDERASWVIYAVLSNFGKSSHLFQGMICGKFPNVKNGKHIYHSHLKKPHGY